MEEKKLPEEELEEIEIHDHEVPHHHHDHEDGHHHGHDDHDHHHHHDDDDEECSCGHDHDHEHHHHHHHDDDDEECSCGHDHDHEHHHHHHHDDDDEECSCGHDHDHEHHHHHHDHGHQYEVPGFRIFETHNHEGATICSFEKDVQTPAEEVITKMQEAIRTLEKWLDETDATIGHVKGYVKEAGPITTFSTVGCGLNVAKHDSTLIAVGFASIVFGPTEEELKDKVAEIFAAI